MKTKEEFAALKKERVATILADDSLSKIEKLATIEEEGLWKYADWVTKPYPEEWTAEIQKLYKKAGGNGTCIIDDQIFDSEDRHSTISYAEGLEYLLENALDELDEEEDNPDPLITVYTTRGTHVALQKKYSEIVDAVFDFACKKQQVGFVFDW